MHLDLHRHLEGSHSAAALAAVARELDLRVAPFFDASADRFATTAELVAATTVTTPSDDPAAFYGCIVAARAAYVSVAAIAALAERAMREAAADASAGAELRLSLFSMARTLIEHSRRAWREVPPAEFAAAYAEPILAAVCAARARVVATTGVPLLLRLGLSRTFESAPHYQALAAMVRGHAGALCGVDVLGIVGGDDREPLPPALRTILDDLRADLPDLTIHAGEFAGADSVARTLALAPQAIGHGVRSLDDPRVIEQLVASGVTLEVCPTSNRLLIPTAVDALTAAHHAAPLVALQRAGVRCVLGSDDPEPLATSYQRERTVAAALGVDLAQLDADAAARWRQLAAG